MIGKGSKILSANGLLPKGERLVVAWKEPQTSPQPESLNECGGSQGLLCQRTWFSSLLP
jgi:hypothetical protein